MMGGHERSPIRTTNALEAVHALLTPYQYFHQPHAVREEAPAELEAIVTSLLTPLLPVVQLLVANTASSVAAGGVAAHDALLHTLCKCLHHTVRASPTPQLLEGLLFMMRRRRRLASDPKETACV